MNKAAALIAACLVLAACAGTPGGGSQRRLDLSVTPASPARLLGGTKVRVLARPEPQAEMAWVSGTVKVFGATPRALKYDAKDKAWVFATQVPSVVGAIPKGKYEIKAWGRTKAGEEASGAMSYEVR